MPTLYSKMLRVSGPDAGKFLQGQVSCDVLSLQDGQSSFGAYCNIKGKVECLFRIEHVEEEYHLVMPTELMDQALLELNKYAIFSKVKLEVQDNFSTINEAEEILQRIPEVYLATSGLFFPHDLNLNAIGAVSFTKGCYRGQEIVARMQHRGNLKRSLCFVRAKTREINIADTVNTDEEEPAGTIVRIFKQADEDTIGLAVLNDALKVKPLFVGHNSLIIS